MWQDTGSSRSRVLLQVRRKVIVVIVMILYVPVQTITCITCYAPRRKDNVLSNLRHARVESNPKL